MPSPVEQNLHSLLPTTNILPSQLVSIASALLAQSKHAAPTLKTEEEIARTYTCCHIACERLANKLTLDIGKINPPCGPRVYKKLHGYLNGVLTAGRTSQPATPRTTRTVDVTKTRTPTSGRATTALKEKPAATPSKTPTQSTKRKRQDDEHASDRVVVPQDMAQLSQHLCRSMKLPEAIPHMYAGLESAWPSLNVEAADDDTSETPSKRQRKLSAKAEALYAKSAKLTLDTSKVPLLVTAMFHTTITRLRGVDVTADEAEDIFGEVLSFLRDKDEALAEAVYDDNYADIAQRISDLASSLQGLPFWQIWHENIPQLTSDLSNGPDRHEDEVSLLPRAKPYKTPLRRREKHANGMVEDDLPGAAGLLPGLGTMFHPAVDWLSDERRAEYATWKRDILKEIATIEQNA